MQLSILAQYVKSSSFDAPNMPQALHWDRQPNLDVEFNISVDGVADGVHEVALHIDVTSTVDGNLCFSSRLTYCGLFAIADVSDEDLPHVLLVDAPKLIFPFARSIIAADIMNGGYPPLLLDPIDFEAAYTSA